MHTETKYTCIREKQHMQTKTYMYADKKINMQMKKTIHVDEKKISICRRTKKSHAYERINNL